MTIGQTLLLVSDIFARNSIRDAYFEARILLGHLLNLSAAQMYTNTEHSLTSQQMDYLFDLINRRLQHEPSAYIVNHREFYGMNFLVDRRVLIPRPETELLVATAIDYVKTQSVNFPNHAISIADIGTGCGNIAISIAKNMENVRIYAIDISSEAIELAIQNSRRHGVEDKILFLQGNLLDQVSDPLDLIVANLPYIKTADLSDLDAEITDYEPGIALDGGENGLKLINNLLKQIRSKTTCTYRVLLEIGAGQEDLLTRSAYDILPASNIQFITDLNGVNRVASIDIINNYS